MELDDLYQEIILDHYKHPRHRKELSDEEVLLDEDNPTCGDHLRLAVSVEGGKIADVRFDGKGCAISMASASLMSERVTGLPLGDARQLIKDFVAVVRGEKEMSAGELGDLAALAGVKQFPLRVKCATMAWHALEKALQKLGV